VEPGHLLVEVLGQHVHAELGKSAVLVNSSIWASTWLVKLIDITKLGCPVALPRFSSRPSASTMTEWPSGKTNSSTCGLMSTLLDVAHAGQAGHVDLVVEVADVADDGVVLHPAMCSAVMMSLLPVAVMKMSAVSSTSSSVVTS
jgi:hypothetical protein